MRSRSQFVLAFAVAGTFALGCQTGPRPMVAMPNPLPREFNKTTMPPYVIEPPDVVTIEGISLVPKPPYRIRPLEALTIRLVNEEVVLPRLKVDGTFTVELDGTVNLGEFYGRVQVAGLTIEEATEAIVKTIAKIVEKPRVYVNLATPRTAPQITGEHLVGQDGTVDLGPYGAVMIAGLTVKEAKEAIELHLSQFLLNPEVSLSVSGYNSKFYYVFYEGGGGTGMSMIRQPIVGSETVLDALINSGGLPANASSKHIYIARPAPDKSCDQIIPVDINAITRRARTETNYQLLPNDRVFVRAQPLDAFNNRLAKTSGTVEGVFGRILLYVSTVQFLQGNSGNPFFFGGFFR
jgi:protein involved in polysaccharide export with SLBB domain